MAEANNPHGACPDPMVLLELAEGTLSGERLKELDTHIDSCTDCRSAISMLSSGRRPIDQADTRRMIGRFERGQPLGEGAMGVVFAARDPELDRKIAIKLLRASAQTPQAISRLQREARALAKLSHPNVVGVFEVGVHAADAPHVFVAMEFVDGVTLRARMREPHGAAEIIRVHVQAGRGLAAAHAVGLVHRDFKPENVLVTPEGYAKVVDFGLAAEETDGPPELSTSAADNPPWAERVALTQTGALVGTPAYMAPEQLRGERADARSDQYAFCVALFEALEGHRPFDAKSPAALLKASATELCFAETPRPQRAALRRGLSYAPADRFDDLDSLLDALEANRSYGMKAVLIVAVALGLLGAAAWYAAPDNQTTPCANAGIVPTRTLSQVETVRAAISSTASVATGDAVAQTMRTWLDDWQATTLHACEASLIRGSQPTNAYASTSSCLERQLAAFSRVASSLESAPPERIAPLLNALNAPAECAHVSLAPTEADEEVRAALDTARVQHAAGEWDAAAQSYDAAAALAEASGSSRLIAAVMLERIDEDEFSIRALGEADEAVHHAQRSGDEQLIAIAWLHRASLVGAGGEPARALENARSAQSILARSEPAPRELAARLQNVLGALHYGLGDLDAARAALQRALALRVGPERAGVLSNLGNVERAAGDFEVALAHHQEALALDLARAGEQPGLARHHHNIGGVLRAADRLDEALVSYRRAIDIASPDSVQLALSLNSLGLVAYAEGDEAGARDAHTRSKELFETLGHGDVVLPAYNLAMMDLRTGEDARALQGFDDVLRTLRGLSEHDTPRVAKNLLGRADALLALGRAAEALEAYESARQMATSSRAEELGVSEALVERATRGVDLTSAVPSPGRGSPNPPAAAAQPETPPESTNDSPADSAGDMLAVPLDRGSGTASYGARPSFD